MATGREILKIVGLAALALLIGQGCSQKSVRVTADSETFEQGAQYADNQGGADQTFGSLQGTGQPGWSQQGEANAQAGEYGTQNSAQGGLTYFGANQNNSESWANSGPLAGLQAYGGGNGDNWASGQGYRNGQGGFMAEEFIQEDYDNIAEAQPFASRGMDQGAQRGQFSRVQVELQDVFFEFNSWRISQNGRQALAHDAEWLDQNQRRSITVEGHCDQRGSRDYNLVLGKKRAGAVRAYLVDLGVENHKIQVTSYGKERPFCFGNNDQCYQLNRRGHLQLHH